VAWIIRVLFILAAPITALFVSKDALNFGVIETFVAIILIVAFAGLAAAWSMYRSPGEPRA
jgi:hypothetical protein